MDFNIFFLTSVGLNLYNGWTFDSDGVSWAQVEVTFARKIGAFILFFIYLTRHINKASVINLWMYEIIKKRLAFLIDLFSLPITTLNSKMAQAREREER